VLAWLTYAAVLSVLGLWFSLVSRTTLRATIATLLTAVGAGVGHWLLWACCVPFFTVFRPGNAPLFKWLINFQVGCTPPLALGYALPFAPEDLTRVFGRPGEAWETIGFVLLGLFCWAVIALALWGAASARFRVVSGRLPLRKDEG
jgi:hypothetical protein